MNIFKALISFFLFCNVAFGQFEVQYPAVYKGEIQEPLSSGYKFKAWGVGRYFICALNEEQGYYLSQNLYKIEAWIMRRWSLSRVPEFSASSSCIVYCIHDPDVLKKLYNGLNESWVEVRKKSGKIDVVAVWLLLNDNPMKTVPTPLTEAILADVSQKYSVSYSLIRGIANLNSPVSQVRQELTLLSQHIREKKPIFYSQALFGFKRENWDKLSVEDRKLFDRESMVLSLLLRKEFGEDKFLTFFTMSADAEGALNRVFGFRNYDEFDISFGRYMRDLSNDIVAGKTPDSYLEIKPK